MVRSGRACGRVLERDLRMSLEPTRDEICEAGGLNANPNDFFMRNTYVSEIRKGSRNGNAFAILVMQKAHELARRRLLQVTPVTKNREEALEAALREARRLNNQSVRDSGEVSEWHQIADALLEDNPEDDRSERWDDPRRVERRKFVKSLFR